MRVRVCTSIPTAVISLLGPSGSMSNVTRWRNKSHQCQA